MRPKTIAATPRSAIAHQFRASPALICLSATEPFQNGDVLLVLILTSPKIRPKSVMAALWSFRKPLLKIPPCQGRHGFRALAHSDAVFDAQDTGSPPRHVLRFLTLSPRMHRSLEVDITAMRNKLPARVARVLFS